MVGDTNEPNNEQRNDKPSFWDSALGTITRITAVIAAITAGIVTFGALVAACNEYVVPLFGGDQEATTTRAPGTTQVATDSIDPTITLLGRNQIEVEAGTEYVDPGAKALDETDGDLSESIQIIDRVDVLLPGTYQVTYTVQDSAGNAASAVRTVIVQDTTPPVITMLGAPFVELERGVEYLDEGATATDSFDSDLTAEIVVNNPVDSATPGQYVVTYNVSDSEGNAAEGVSRSVFVTEDFGAVGSYLSDMQLSGIGSELGAYEEAAWINLNWDQSSQTLDDQKTAINELETLGEGLVRLDALEELDPPFSLREHHSTLEDLAAEFTQALESVTEELRPPDPNKKDRLRALADMQLASFRLERELRYLCSSANRELAASYEACTDYAVDPKSLEGYARDIDSLAAMRNRGLAPTPSEGTLRRLDEVLAGWDALTAAYVGAERNTAEGRAEFWPRWADFFELELAAANLVTLLQVDLVPPQNLETVHARIERNALMMRAEASKMKEASCREFFERNCALTPMPTPPAPGQIQQAARAFEQATDALKSEAVTVSALQ